ncbi:hypothetical protein ERICIV_01583 [Paenibacillus larvae subsp. larvae]|uniref:Uncharacterized protein n=2 Tax=Paenibacillus larvae TaxID=1464 RepID=A0A1U9YQZ8_9BACL|nr:hypothetical protein [Paenibacillus larvae]AQT86229.1 hypothetical protein B1222_20295 [Paenibacillus larvae subsp. pulvifaciens]AQZ47856.1 hypothetical protein B5S25_15965 [Paenibacillus larvae subsp. pulvifaciens]ARF69614.1 hypothetical protein B7C51_19985 [Paenibacillus larvae subsp. pulvifaciens]AVF25748.1 hypothetical protein ERICIII_01562 [Paenibacillus larvae subsp. larvae]AVF30525.1 hypothetical protein ERICIV_01583 [Paenibacillus larvae subsp. larvae]
MRLGSLLFWGAIGTAVFMFFRRRNRGKMMAMFNSTGNAMENMIGTAGKEAASTGKQSIRTSNAMDKQRVQDIIAKNPEIKTVVDEIMSEAQKPKTPVYS